MYATTLVTLTLAAYAAAQTVHTVSVGVGGFVFSPNNITAAAGDVVQFVFSGTPGAHSVTQSSFAAPCKPLANGFNSGFVTVAAGATGPFEEYNITVVNATQPIWFYCAQTNPSSHCISGMVGAINAPTTGNTLANFTAAAKALASFPAQSPSNAPTGGVGVSISAAPATGDNAAATNTAPASAEPTSSGSGSGSSTSGAGSSPATSPTAASSATKLSTGFITLILTAIFGISL